MRRTAAAVGRTLITLGVLILLFTVYLLWGTGIYTSQQQNHLRQQFDAALHRVAPTTTPRRRRTPSGRRRQRPRRRTPRWSPATQLARIQIPNIGLDNIVVSGVGGTTSARDPATIPRRPFRGRPGTPRSPAIARPTVTPFGDIDQLANGDVIMVQTLQGSFTYRVYAQLVVDPSDVAVPAIPIQDGLRRSRSRRATPSTQRRSGWW